VVCGRGFHPSHSADARALEERRDCLLSYAAQYLGDQLQFERRPSGLHLVGWFPDDADERELAMLADQHGITVHPLSEFLIEPDGRRGLVLGFAAFGEAEIKEGVQKLAAAWNTPHRKSKRTEWSGLQSK
jgi:GntR family transcriptional regulator/MocR family aminotransferase